MFTLITAILGFLSGTIPGVVNLFGKKADHAHELKLAELQMEAAKQGVELQISLANAQADIQQQQSIYNFDSSSSGVRWVDALRSSVRPVITYVFFIMWLAVEVLLLVYGLNRNLDLIQLAKLVWDENTQVTFVAIISFWFGGRAFDKWGGATKLAPITAKKR